MANVPESLDNPYSAPSELTAGESRRASSWFYYGWVNVVIGAMAMFATMPGRTQGLGLFTKGLLEDLKLEQGEFAHMNLWATLIGALFCLPAGRLLDRWGARSVLAIVVLALGLTVWALSAVESALMLFVLITLTRGFGQSALSVVSIALVGKWFRRRLTLAMSIYSVLVVLLFAWGFGWVGGNIRALGWRAAEPQIAMGVLVVFLPLAVVLARSTPESIGVEPDEPHGAAEQDGPADEVVVGPGFTLAAALRTPAFWIFAGGASLYGLVSSGLGLFNQSILAERGFEEEVFHDTLVLTTMVSLAGQAASAFAGWLGSLRRVMAIALFLYAGALLSLPHIDTLAGVRAYAVVMGLSGGIITVVFFAVWGETFGRAHLGRIQGAAQLLTVLASAVGPLLFAKCHDRFASYSPLFFTLAPIVVAFGVAAWLTPAPKASLE
jgi:MFS family permease